MHSNKSHMLTCKQFMILTCVLIYHIYYESTHHMHLKAISHQHITSMYKTKIKNECLGPLDINFTSQSNRCEEASSPSAFSASPCRVASDLIFILRLHCNSKKPRFTFKGSGLRKEYTIII